MEFGNSAAQIKPRSIFQMGVNWTGRFFSSSWLKGSKFFSLCKRKRFFCATLCQLWLYGKRKNRIWGPSWDRIENLIEFLNSGISKTRFRQLVRFSKWDLICPFEKAKFRFYRWIVVWSNNLICFSKYTTRKSLIIWMLNSNFFSQNMFFRFSYFSGSAR